jgi:hypothetical protein
MHMSLIGMLAGLWFATMGWYALTHADRSPESGAAHWMSTPSRRRTGGVVTIVVGFAVALASVAWL